MALADDILNEVTEIFKESWQNVNGQVIPKVEDIALTNKGTFLEAVVLYADMADSTKLVMDHTPEFASEIYKVFLKTCCRIIRSEGGEITAFDGDRVMAVFIGDSKNSSAAKTALKINYAIPNIVNKQLIASYPNKHFSIEYSIGIDSSKLLAIRAGIRGSNDIVWVGDSANLSAKLCSLRNNGKRIWITERVFNSLSEDKKYGGSPKQLMWERHTWQTYGINVYCSTWHWPF